MKLSTDGEVAFGWKEALDDVYRSDIIYVVIDE